MLREQLIVIKLSTRRLNARRVLASVGIVLLFIIVFFLVGMFVDINIILKYNMTPVSFTRLLPFCELILGTIVAWKLFFKKS